MEELHRLARRIREAATAQSMQHVRVVGSVAIGTARTDSVVTCSSRSAQDSKAPTIFAALGEFREACIRITRRPVDVIDEARVPDDATRRWLARHARPYERRSATASDQCAGA